VYLGYSFISGYIYYLIKLLFFQDEILCNMHTDFLMAAPSLVLCLQRENAVKKLCDLIGPSDPKAARRLGSGLWRGTFGSDPISNGLHGEFSYSSIFAIFCVNMIKLIVHFFTLVQNSLGTVWESINIV
jgi:nucleoside diphosphate kinase